MSTSKRADRIATVVMLVVITVATVALAAVDAMPLPGRIAIAVGAGLVAAIITRAVLGHRARAGERSVSGTAPDRPSQLG